MKPLRTLALAAALSAVALPAQAQTTLGGFASDTDFLAWETATSFEKFFGADMRWGNNSSGSPLAGDWELGIVEPPPVFSTVTEADYAWGAPTTFTFTYDPFEASLAVGGSGIMGDVSSLVGGGSISHILARAKASGGATGALRDMTVTLLGGPTIFSGSLVGDGDAEYVSIYDTRLADGFTVTGTVALADGTSGSDPIGQFKVGTAVVTTPEPGTFALLLLGLSAFGVVVWRRREEMQLL
jgi:hypothetical protein